MDTAVGLIAELKERMELNRCGLFNFLLKKRENQHFYGTRLKKNTVTRFDFAPLDIVWANDFIYNVFTDPDGNEYHEIMIDVHVTGRIRQSNRTTYVEFVNEPISFDFTIRAYFDDKGYLCDNNIFLLSKEQKALVNYQLQYQQELKRSGIKNIVENRYQDEEAFSFFTRIWRKPASQRPPVSSSTDMHFFNELVEVHRNIMYSVSCAQMWGRYITLHGDHAYKFEGKTVYPLNTSFYDNRHIFYLEVAMEELYTFYERIAHLLYVFLRPNNFEPQALSFKKLFERYTKRSLEKRFLGLASNEHYQWFVKRIQKEHLILSNYRHPLIHYRTDHDFIKGSYTTYKARIWLKNAFDSKDALAKLEKEMAKMLAFVSREVHVCLEAFERTVLLIEDLTPSDDVPDEPAPSRPALKTVAPTSSE